jgi:hypothetical protein
MWGTPHYTSNRYVTLLLQKNPHERQSRALGRESKALNRERQNDQQDLMTEL